MPSAFAHPRGMALVVKGAVEVSLGVEGDAATGPAHRRDIGQSRRTRFIDRHPPTHRGRDGVGKDGADEHLPVAGRRHRGSARWRTCRCR